MRLPEVAARLRALAVLHSLPELADLASELSRRKGWGRGHNVSNRMTVGLAIKITQFAHANPGMPQSEIARIFNVNSGRVSEILSGKRT